MFILGHRLIINIEFTGDLLITVEKKTAYLMEKGSMKTKNKQTI